MGAALLPVAAGPDPDGAGGGGWGAARAVVATGDDDTFEQAPEEARQRYQGLPTNWKCGRAKPAKPRAAGPLPTQVASGGSAA